MRTTIDKAGRVVIPAAIREKARLEPGMELEVVLDDISIRLIRSVPGPRVVREGNRSVVRASVPMEDLPAINLGDLIEDERNRWPW